MMLPRFDLRGDADEDGDSDNLQRRREGVGEVICQGGELHSVEFIRPAAGRAVR